MPSDTPPTPRKTGGRPRKSEETRLSEPFRVRVTRDQAAAFRQRAKKSGLSPTELLRRLVTGRVKKLDDLVIELDDIAFLREKCGELSVVQDRIKRLASREARADLDAIARQLEQELEGVRELVKRLEPRGTKG